MEILTNDHPDVIRNGVRYKLTIYIDRKLRYIAINGPAVKTIGAKVGDRIYFLADSNRFLFYVDELPTSLTPALTKHCARSQQLRATCSGIVRTLVEKKLARPGETYTIMRTTYYGRTAWEVNFQRAHKDVQTITKTIKKQQK